MNQEHYPQPPQLPQQQNNKGSKDKLFVLVTAIVLGNLAFHLWNTISWLVTEPASIFLWSLAVANVVAVVGLLYLMRDYTKRVKAQKGGGDAKKV